MQRPADHHRPLAGELPELLNRYGIETNRGRILRKGDAKLMLKRMAEAEDVVRAERKQRETIADRIARMNAIHEWNTWYLLQFGVRADERRHFQTILQQATEHGGLTLLQAADLAHAQRQAELQSSNADGGNSSSFSTESIVTQSSAAFND